MCCTNAALKEDLNEDLKGAALPRVKLALLIATSNALTRESLGGSLTSLERDTMDRF